MIDLPIAERELRIAARSLRTYTSRRNTAGVAILVFFWLYWMLGMHGGAAGAKVFGALSFLCFIYALFTGIILTSDCVSMEKREGTLGLLFLTSLKSHDIVAGNILATSLKAFYGLLAAFPVLGISFVMGGISYGEFGRVCFVLISTLLFSLAFSLFISCLSEKHLVATTRAALGLLFFSVILPMTCLGLRQLLPYAAYSQRFVEILELFSPSPTLARTSSSSLAVQQDFWWSLLIINLMSLGLLGLCCFALPRVWRDRASAPPKWIWIERLRGWRCARWRDPARTRLLDRNPFYWLASRRSLESIKFLMGSLALCILASFVARKYVSRFIGGKFPEFAAQTVAWGCAAIAAHAVLLFKFAALSSHRFGEDRKSGALELLLVTPLTVRQILRGQWLAMRRQLGGPILAVLFMHGLLFWAFLIFCGMDEGIPGGAWDVLKFLRSSLLEFDNFLVPFCIGLTLLGSAAALCLNWIALAWVGMWVGLRTRRTAIAAWLTLAIVLFPPLPIYTIIIFFGDWFGFSQNLAYWAGFCLATGFGLEFLNAFILIGWSRHKLRQRFRIAAADRFQTRPAGPWITTRMAWRCAFGAATAVFLVLLFYNEEKWRGLRTWHRLEREYAARGQKLTTKPQAPADVPEAKNFGAASIFKPLFDYFRDESGAATWRNNPARLSLLTINLSGQERNPWQPSPTEPFASWALQQFINLTNWQQFYRTNTLFAGLSSTNEPAMAVLKVLSSFDPVLNELERASRMPYARFPIHYEEGWGACVFHRNLLKNVAQIVEIRTVAKLDLGENDAALVDIEFCIRLADSLKMERGFQPRSIRYRILLSALQPVWEGLARHRWTEENLKRLQKLFEIDILNEYRRGLREEITALANIWNIYTEINDRSAGQMGFTPGMRAAAKFYPLGWKYLNQAGLLRLCEHDLIPMVDSKAQRVFIPIEGDLQQAARHSGVMIDPLFHLVGHPNYADIVKQFAHTQVSLDEAVIACALERWYLSHGEFPLSLKMLMPKYLDRLPTDPISGTAYKYHLLPSGLFLLYSAGWNGRDDGGQIANASPGAREQNLNEGDWVWSYIKK